eukprot:6197204-Pleurochrysis_carterae.AAC.3
MPRKDTDAICAGAAVPILRGRARAAATHAGRRVAVRCRLLAPAVVAAESRTKGCRSAIGCSVYTKDTDIRFHSLSDRAGR